jgi:hypothetical protein
MGMGKNPIQSTLTTLQVLKHYIRTAFGDSTDSYNGPTLLPLQGVVQGNGVASAGWSVVSTPIINLMRDAGYGFLHWSAIENEVVRIVCFTFVDDTDLVHTAAMDATGEDMQTVLDTWEGGLKATGGALVPKNSYWYLIDFKCNANGKWTYRKIKDIPDELTLPVPDDHERVTLKRLLEVNEARKALGSMSRRDGKETDNVKFSATRHRHGPITSAPATYNPMMHGTPLSPRF